MNDSADSWLSGRRVTVVGPIPPPAGGMAKQTRALVDHLNSDGADADLVAVNAPVKPAFVNGIPLIRAVWRLPGYCFRLVRTIRRTEIVHILANSGLSWHLFAAPAIWIGWLLGKPVILNYRGGLAADFFARQWWLVKPTLRRAAAVIVPSRYLVGVFEQYAVDALEIPNIIDIDRYRHRGSDRRFAGHIIATRNLEQIYGLDTAIRVMGIVAQQLPDAKLSIAGSGPERDTLESLVESMDLTSRVEFLGRLDDDAILSLYRSADILLNTSRVDNSPNSLIEAMAAGIPIVSTDVGGIPYLVDDNVHAKLAAVDDDQALADAIIEIAENVEVRKRLVENAFNRVQKFHWSNVGRQLQDVYRNAV